MRTWLLWIVVGGAAAAGAQEAEWQLQWRPPLMGHPTKLSPDRKVDDEYPAAVRDARGRIWVVWSSCRTKSAEWPEEPVDLAVWRWEDDGEDVVVARYFDGEEWSEEEVVSGIGGVNHRPAVVADGDGVRVLWTARRGGVWAAYERRWSEGRWEEERRIPGSDGALEIRATAPAGGGLLAVLSKLAPPRIELHAMRFESGRWSSAERLDEGQGRCFRASLLATPGGWMAAWDEERDGNYDVWVRRSGGRAERISDSGLWDTAPALARTPEGRIWLAWERRIPVGGRFTYEGRSIFGKFFEGARWQWAPSPFPEAEPGRLTRHSRYWATQGISEERYPQWLVRHNGDLWLFWLGGGRMSSTAFAGRLWRGGRWSEPRLFFHDPVPYPSWGLGSARRGVDLRTRGRWPYQTPLCNQMAVVLDDAGGLLWMAYEVPKRRHITDKWPQESLEIQLRPAGYGADVFAHRVDLDEREYRQPRVVDEASPLPAMRPRAYRPTVTYTATIGGEKFRLVFGDLHGHTENDAIGTVDMYYAFGLMVAGMDFVASTNHDYTPDFLTQSEWAATQALASVYDAMAERTAFSGWEWTTSPADVRGGHRALYYLNDNGPLYRSTTMTSDTVWKLYRLLRGQDVILQPHHNGWEGYDAELQPIMEITSAWRQMREEGKEFKPRGKVQSAWEALERGYRIGLVGSGDTHWLGPGEDYGITGAWVRELSREGVFEAIRARRVFASTGPRLSLEFRVNGTFMGGETRGRESARVEVAVTGAGELERVEIIRDHRIIHAAGCEGRTARIDYLDQAGRLAGRRSSYYYARVTQKDGMKAWSSPVWVDWE